MVKLLTAVGVILVLQCVSMIYIESRYRRFTDGDIGEGYIRMMLCGVGVLLIIAAIILSVLGWG